MGLPTKYQHPELGLCLTLHGALSHLRTRGIAFRQEGEQIVITSPHSADEIRVSPVALPVGKMYPVKRLEGTSD